MASYTRAFGDLRDGKLEFEFVRVLKTWRGLFPEPIIRELERRHDSQAQTAGSAPAPVLGKRSQRPAAFLSPALKAVLADLRNAVSQPPHLYQAGLVASIFAHVQINRIEAGPSISTFGKEGDLYSTHIFTRFLTYFFLPNS